jgi:hypothetical protein
MAIVARFDPRSDLPDFGIKLSKSETSDFDAIQYPQLAVVDGLGMWFDGGPLWK